MTPRDAEPPRMATAEFSVAGDDWQFTARAAVPVGPTRVDDLLPLAQSMADQIVVETCKAVDAAGERVSCKKGCAACCRTLVAISEIEARHIRELVDELPEPRRSHVRGRFVDAEQRLERAGLLDALQEPDRMTGEQYNDIMAPYFQLGIACPFLEDESCSIYAQRPITCREFLVTSPAEHCAKVDSADVVRVRLPLRVFNAVARWNVPPSAHLNERWVPLALAPQWVESHPDEPPLRPGVDLLREFVERLSIKADATNDE